MIITLTPSHLNELVEIESVSTSFPWTEQKIASSFNDQHWLLGLTHEGRLIGHVIAMFVLDEVNVLTICVHPDFQGKGYGRALMQALFNRAIEHHMRDIYLEVRLSNHIAYQLYCALGFEQVGVRKDYYPTEFGREDGYVMKHRL